MITFSNRFQELAKTRTPLCLGIDPSIELLNKWKLTIDIGGLQQFCDTILDAAGDLLAVIKPQSAFFEQFGPEGLAQLKRLLQQIRERGTLSLVDCKRGDIGHTIEAYADTFLGLASPYQADAITVSPYLGIGALEPIFKKAVHTGSGVFVVVRSSNPEGRVLQNAKLEDGRMVADWLADSITGFNENLGEKIGPIGAVVGATIDELAKQTLNRLPKSLLLAPGIGAQGATFTDLRRSFGGAIDRTLPAVSRGILAQGPSVDNLKQAILEHRKLVSLK